MKKLLLTLIMLLSILSISCEKKPTDPITNNQNSKVMNSFSGTFQFGNFGNVSALAIKNDNTIYMTLDKSIIEIDKSMVTKVSDAKYQIKGDMPNINTSLSRQLANLSHVDMNIDIANNNLSLSGKTGNSPINANLIGTGSSFNSKYAGTYVWGEGPSRNEYEIKDNGDMYFCQYLNDEMIYKEDQKSYLIKKTDNIYYLIFDVSQNISGTINKDQARLLISERAQKYYNIIKQQIITFSDDKFTLESYEITMVYDPAFMNE